MNPGRRAENVSRFGEAAPGHLEQWNSRSTAETERVAVKEFYLKRGENTYGPLSSAQLRTAARSGRVATDDQVSRSKNGPWRLASEVGGLFPAAASNAPSEDVEASSDSGNVETETYMVVDTATSDVPEHEDEYSWADEDEDYEADFPPKHRRFIFFQPHCSPRR
ncbi:GYF domain-containing protein [Maioricimonas sp. JC845]|uniref:GYF domain-containing protein n=1 Tax=Maioricimonas sp. JC845 TaxID=3232138 RepID=UPI00345809FB